MSLSPRALCILLLAIAWIPEVPAQQTPTLSVAERSLPNGTVFANYTDAAIYLRGLIGAASDPYGTVTVDMGSASAGRCTFRLSEVVLAIEKRDEEPGCADICPPRAIIIMNCTHGPCASDLMLKGMDQDSCSFTVFDQPLGDQVYEVLRIMQRFLRKG